MQAANGAVDGNQRLDLAEHREPALAVLSRLPLTTKPAFHVINKRQWEKVSLDVDFFAVHRWFAHRNPIAGKPRSYRRSWRSIHWHRSERERADRRPTRAARWRMQGRRRGHNGPGQRGPRCAHALAPEFRGMVVPSAPVIGEAGFDDSQPARAYGLPPLPPSCPPALLPS